MDKRNAPIIRMKNNRQLRHVKKLVKSSCANYFEGNCLLLEDGYDPTPCPQMLTYSLCCRYFLAAVLPADKALYAELLKADGRKRCAACGQHFTGKGRNALYCQSCAAMRKRNSTRLAMQKIRGLCEKSSTKITR